MDKKYLRVLPAVMAALAMLLGACAPVTPIATTTPRPTRAGTLVHYTGPSATDTPTPGDPASPTPLPSATSTPRSHTVRNGEDMWGISLRYGITLDDLLKANPGVDPRFLSIGKVLVIPAAVYTPTPDPNNPPQPTPVSLALRAPVCYPSGDGGLWCFTRADSSLDYSVEGLAVNLRLYDRDTGQIISQSAFPPLNQLTPRGFLPLAAYFTPPAPRSFDATVELVSALPVPPDSGRYLTVKQSDVKIEIAADGLTAAVSGNLSLASEGAQASSLHVAAVAFDAFGQIVGLRRWDSNSGLALGSTLPFELLVYTAGPPIASVTVLAEAAP